jgi:hypothetical protein
MKYKPGSAGVGPVRLKAKNLTLGAPQLLNVPVFRSYPAPLPQADRGGKISETPRFPPQSRPQCQPINPPGFAEWLLVLIIPRRSAQLGCLEERFHRHVDTRGLRRTRALYWAEVMRSILPILWTKARKLGVIALIAEIWRRSSHS